jgi:hypothetical protein
MRAAWILALCWAGCFSPDYPENLLCSEKQTCPEGQRCNLVTGRCVGGDGGVDGEYEGPTAEGLGTACVSREGSAGECEAFELGCFVFAGDGDQQASGFCTMRCGGPSAQQICQTGYSGPGQATCVGLLTEDICVVRCGAEWSLPDDCPEGLTCRDTDRDSQNDTCLPPAPGTP